MTPSDLGRKARELLMICPMHMFTCQCVIEEVRKRKNDCLTLSGPSSGDATNQRSDNPRVSVWVVFDRRIGQPKQRLSDDMSMC